MIRVHFVYWNEICHHLCYHFIFIVLRQCSIFNAFSQFKKKKIDNEEPQSNHCTSIFTICTCMMYDNNLQYTKYIYIHNNQIPFNMREFVQFVTVYYVHCDFLIVSLFIFQFYSMLVMAFDLQK